MANEQLKQEIERLKRLNQEQEEAEELKREIAKLRQEQWEREHPRMTRFSRFFSNSRF